MEIEGLILDFDDTLIKMTPERWGAFESALRSFGADDSSVREMNKIKGAAFGALVKVAAPGVELIDFLTSYRDMLTADRIEICAGVPELLAWATDASLKTVVFSSSSHMLIERDLELANIRGHFHALFGFEDVPAPKPDPASVRALLAAHPLREISPDRVLMVGDSLADASAAAGQVGFAAVLSGSTTRESFEAAGIPQRAIVESLHELAARLASSECLSGPTNRR